MDDRKLSGLFKEYDAQGSLKDLVKYDAGVVDTKAQEAQMLDIKKTYHPNMEKKLASMGSYSRAGKKEGLFREFTTRRGFYHGKHLCRGPARERGIGE